MERLFIQQKRMVLGLMITYKIIKEHQGSIAIQSSVGLGTKVEISLPTV
ncbi:Sporulation kinase E [Bacillus mobilis]|nr:Sporulation kinase E [Bacillus mobilis]